MKDTLAHVADTLTTAAQKLHDYGHEVATGHHSEAVDLSLQV